MTLHNGMVNATKATAAIGRLATVKVAAEARKNKTVYIIAACSSVEILKRLLIQN